jgi:hypothetical protein
MEEVLINIITFIVMLILIVFALKLLTFFVALLFDLKTRVLLKAEYDGNEIIVKRSFRKTQLIVNSEVKEEKIGLFERGYSLRTKINEQYIMFLMKPKKLHMEMTLTAGEELLAYQIRKI